MTGRPIVQERGRTTSEQQKVADCSAEGKWPPPGRSDLNLPTYSLSSLAFQGFRQEGGEREGQGELDSENANVCD